MATYKLCNGTLVEWKKDNGNKVPETSTDISDTMRESFHPPEVRLLCKYLKDLNDKDCKAKVKKAYEGLLTVEGMNCQNIGT